MFIKFIIVLHQEIWNKKGKGNIEGSSDVWEIDIDVVQILSCRLSLYNYNV